MRPRAILMTYPPSMTFAIAINNREIYRTNFLASPCLQSGMHEFVVQEGFSSAAKAYNDAIERSSSDLIVFAHQDVILPKRWLLDLKIGLEHLDRTDPNWGVLGCYGTTADNAGAGFMFSNGVGLHGRVQDPVCVQTLDEIVLIIRKSSGLRFDEDLPHFHFYGADICMTAMTKGMRSYALAAFCIHNQQQNIALPQQFYDCYYYFKKKWRRHLPVYTTCVTVSTSNYDMYKRRLWEAYVRYIQRAPVGAARISNGQSLIEQFESVRTASHSAASHV